MLQLDNNNNQRGTAHGSDFNQNNASSIFPSPSITNGNGLPVSTPVVRNGPSFMGLTSGAPLPPHGPLSAGLPHGPGHVGSMIHWGTGSPQNLALTSTSPLQQSGSGVLYNSNVNKSNANNDNSEDDDDDDYRPFTPPPPRERLSYTRYQLELLNGIYNEVRYPNSTQKQLIAKRVGITREQVKIWFQNRRRKDVVSKGGKSDSKDNDPAATTTTTADTNSNADISDPNSNGSSTKQDDVETDPACSSSKLSRLGNGSSNNDSGNGTLIKEDSDSSDSKDKMVSIVVLNSIIAELQKFNNEYLKQKKNRKKNKSKSAKHAASLAAAAAAASNASAAPCKSKRLFQSYDMIAPPNKVTPTAFLNTAANRFKHAGGTSAFQNPRENRLMPIPPLNLGDNRLWDGFALTNCSSFPSTIESSDLLQQRSPVDASSAISAIPSSLAQSFGIQSQTPHQQAAAYGGLLSGPMAAVHHLNSQTSLYDNLPVLSDLLNSYKNQQSASAVAAAAVAHRQQLEHSLLSSTSGSPGRPQPPTQPFFHLPSGGHSTTGSLGSSGGSATSTSTNSTGTGDDNKSPLSDLTFPSPTTPPTHPFPFNSHHHSHHPHSSTFALNRVFPFPLIADSPVMLSSIRQSDSTFRTHPPHQWPHPPSSLGQTNPPIGVAQTFGSSQISPSSAEDPYRPLLISSLNNPYFSSTPSSSYPPFTPSTLPPAPQHTWSASPPGTDSSEFTSI